MTSVPRQSGLRSLCRVIAFITIALGGYELALPDTGLGVRMSVAYGLFLGHAVLIAYLLFFLSAGGITKLNAVLVRNRNASFAFLIAALGIAGIVSAGINHTSVLDLGQAARLILYGVYFLLLVYWARRRGPAFVLGAYLAGIAAGGLVNVYYTISSPPLIVFDVLPVLHASNGAGGLLAMAVVFSAWLWLIATSRADRWLAMAVTAVGGCAVGLSFSKTAMLIGFLGLAGWFSILFRLAVWRTWAGGAVAGLLLVMGAVWMRPFGLDAGEAAGLLVRAVQVKFGHMTLESKFGIDDYNITGSRYAYWPMTFRVLESHPVAGVGYSGLYDAYAEARTGYEHLALTEVEGSRATNPHNSFLYYIGANGFPGLVVVSVLFVAAGVLLFRSCAVYGLHGRLLWMWMTCALVVYGFTLPTLFNTEVLYLPVAVAVAHVAAAHRLRLARRPAQQGGQSAHLKPAVLP